MVRKANRRRKSVNGSSNRAAASVPHSVSDSVPQDSRPRSCSTALQLVVTLAQRKCGSNGSSRPASTSGSNGSTNTEDDGTLDDDLARMGDGMTTCSSGPFSHNQALVLFEQSQFNPSSQCLIDEDDDGLPAKGFFGPARRQSDKDGVLSDTAGILSQHVVNSSSHPPGLDNETIPHSDVSINLPIGCEVGISRDCEDALPGLHGTPLPPVVQPIIASSPQNLLSANEEDLPYQGVFRPGYPRNFSITGSPLCKKRPGSIATHTREGSPSLAADSSWAPAPAFLEECRTSPVVKPAGTALLAPSEQELPTVSTGSMPCKKRGQQAESTAAQGSHASKLKESPKTASQRNNEAIESADTRSHDVDSIQCTHSRSERHRLRNHTKSIATSNLDSKAQLALKSKAPRKSRRTYESQLMSLAAKNDRTTGNHLCSDAHRQSPGVSSAARSVPAAKANADQNMNIKKERKPPGRKSLGCWTCKLRRKKCDETHPACQACLKLGIPCNGYSTVRPDFMKDPALNASYRAQIKSMTQIKSMISAKKFSAKQASS